MNKPLKEWKVVKISELLTEISNGTTATQNTSNTGVPVTRIESIQNGCFDMKRVRWIDDLSLNMQKWYYQDGDIAFSHINSETHVGKVALYSSMLGSLIHGMNLLRLRPDHTVVYPEFLFWFLQSPCVRQQIQAKLKRAINQASINQKDLKDLKILLPDLSTQKYIIAFIKECMSRVDEIRLLQDEALREANSLFEAFIEAQIELDWMWQPIFEITTEVRNGWSWKESPTGQPIQVLRLSAVRNLSLDLNEVRTVCLESKQAGEFSLKKDDVFMVRGNGSKHLVGRSAISTDDHPNIVFNDLLIRLRFTSEMLPEFANFMLHSRKVREQIEQAAKTAAGIWKINQTGIRSLKLPCPPISVQKDKLATLQEGLAASRQIVQHFAQTDTKALSAAILRKAFAGEL